MTRSPFARVGVLALLMAAAAASPAVAQKKSGKKQESRDRPVLYAVVQVDQEFRIVTKSGVAQLKKDLKREHKEAVAAHKAAAKDAKKNKEKFDVPAPKAKKLKVVKPSIDKEGAEKLIAELEAKAAAKGERKERPAKERSRGKQKRKGRDEAKAGRG
jgi:hypothetical protein